MHTLQIITDVRYYEGKKILIVESSTYVGINKKA